MGYYALDHPNPNATAKGYPGYWGYPSMNQTPTALALHTTESLADLDGPDEGAENVANWFQTNDTFALYHTLVDSDSTIRMVPAGLDGTTICTAFHAAGYNSHTVGLSMAIRADSWPKLPADYKDRILTRAAAEGALLCARWGWPIVKRTKAEIDAGAKGITGHGILDPGYRSDPGAEFPWDDFINRVKAAGGGTQPPDQGDDEVPVLLCNMAGSVYGLFSDGVYRGLSGPEYSKWNGKVDTVTHSKAEWDTLRSWGRVL